MKRILFLGYGPNETILYEVLRNEGCDIQHLEAPVQSLSSQDLVISFGYRHKLNAAILATSKRPVINLHMSYLPFNRGAHPNFWAHYDNTPHGVTIHEMDAHFDTGPIIFQKLVHFSEKERTFRQRYIRLFQELETLFITNSSFILSGAYTAKPQNGEGSHHRISDLPKEFSGWDCDIDNEIASLKQKAR